MKQIFILLLGLCLVVPAARAADGDQSIDDWVTSMLRRIPFATMGSVDRKEFQADAHRYLDGLIAHYTMMSANLRSRAEKAGDTARVRLIDERTSRLIEEATMYVRDTEIGMMRTLDPEGKGDVGRRGARKILSALAAHADMNSDGVLDRYEAILAEAAFAKGRDLGSPGEIRRLIIELDRSPMAWQ